ncbi:hypothetical protein [Massilia sp. PWRC2]|uniref:hypothetical protein n=1 Tax=Massilia sp. PWRC2 TaxID=2804626 RepID=UPI003CEBEF6E
MSKPRLRQSRQRLRQSLLQLSRLLRRPLRQRPLTPAARRQRLRAAMAPPARLCHH